MKRSLAAAAAVAVSLLAVTPAQAATVTPSQRAHTALNQMVARVQKATSAHHGNLPTQRDGAAIAHAVEHAAGPNARVYYVTDRANTVYCAASLQLVMHKSWIYDSVLGTVRKVGSLTHAGGACGALFTDKFAAGAREIAAVSDARGLGTYIEALATDSGTYPSSLSDLAKDVPFTFSAGDSVAVYRYLPASNTVPAGFRFCIVNTHGAWVAYASRLGGIVNSGTHGKACLFQSAKTHRREVLVRDVKTAGAALSEQMKNAGKAPARADAASLAKAGVSLSAGVSVGFYQTYTYADAPAYRLCLTHRGGGWATYSSVTGFIAASGTGHACQFTSTFQWGSLSVPLVG